MKTEITEVAKVKLKKPILIEGLPGLGMVGRITVRYLVKTLKAERLAQLHSPHFPYYVLVNKKGNVRLLHGEFHSWRNEDGESDLILLTGDSQAQTIEGQYEVAESILEFAGKHGVKTIFTIGGFRVETEEAPKVVVASSSSELLEKAVQAGAMASGAGNPVVGTAGLLLGLGRFKKIDALCLLGETRGYLPDPKSAKSVLAVLAKLLKIELDLAGLDKEIEKAEKIVAKMKQIERRRELHAKKMRKMDEEKVTYIS